MRPLLSGYGVQLSVKSTEYKAVDDSQVQGGVEAMELPWLCCDEMCNFR